MEKKFYRLNLTEYEMKVLMCALNNQESLDWQMLRYGEMDYGDSFGCYEELEAIKEIKMAVERAMA